MLIFILRIPFQLLLTGSLLFLLELNLVTRFSTRHVHKGHFIPDGDISNPWAPLQLRDDRDHTGAILAIVAAASFSAEPL